MRILLVGADGAIGSAVEAGLGKKHEIIRAGRSRGDVRIDISSEASISRVFEETLRLDAVIAAAGELHFGPLMDMTSAQLAFGINSKLLGQVNLARYAAKYIADGGSVTLVSGIIGEQPVAGGAIAAVLRTARCGSRGMPRSQIEWCARTVASVDVTVRRKENGYQAQSRHGRFLESVGHRMPCYGTRPPWP